MAKTRCCSLETSAEDLRSGLFWRAVVAELVGTLFLVMVGCGSCISWHLKQENWESRDAPGVLQIALCFGLAVATMAWCLGDVSGCHINPAVTVAMVATRKVSAISVCLKVSHYIIFTLSLCVNSRVPPPPPSAHCYLVNHLCLNYYYYC